MRPSENIHYEEIGPRSVEKLNDVYDHVLSKAKQIAKDYPRVRGMVIQMLIKVRAFKENYIDTGEIEIDGNNTYVTMNVLIDTGVCGSILDMKTTECYVFDELTVTFFYWRPQERVII